MATATAKKSTQPQQDDATPHTPAAGDVPTGWITPSRFNPRKHFDEAALQELADSIKAHGLLEPLVVRDIRDDRGNHTGRYEIIAGERRHRAAQLAGLELVPVRVLRDVGDRTALELAIIENLQRVDLDPIEEAQGYAALREQAGMKQTEIAAAVKKGQPAIARSLGLLKLPEDVQELIRDGTLSAAHGAALERFAPFPAYLQALARVAISQNWTSKRLAEGEIYADYTMLQAGGPLRGVHHPTAIFDTGICLKCPFGAYRTSSWEGAGYCLRPEHYDELHAAAYAAKQEEAAKRLATVPAGTTGAVSLEGLHWKSYTRLYPDAIPAGCSEACECRTQGVTKEGDVITVCMNPPRLQQLRAAHAKAEKAARKQKALDQMTAVAATLQATTECTSRDLALLVWAAFRYNIHLPAMRAAAERQAPSLLPLKETPTIPVLMQLSPLQLVRLAVDALLTSEQSEMVEYEYKVGTLTELWQRGAS